MVATIDDDVVCGLIDAARRRRLSRWTPASPFRCSCKHMSSTSP